MSVLNTQQIMDILPGNPVMPGVLIIEALAQTGAVAILCQDEWKGKTAYFAGINNAKFKQKVVPGDTLELTTEIIKVKGPIGVGKAVARVNGKVACMAEMPVQHRKRKRMSLRQSFVPSVARLCLNQL